MVNSTIYEQHGFTLSRQSDFITTLSRPHQLDTGAPGVWATTQSLSIAPSADFPSGHYVEATHTGADGIRLEVVISRASALPFEF